jgi:PAS domain S-box-containing protein
MNDFYPKGKGVQDDPVKFALSAAGIGTWDVYLQENGAVSIDELCRELLGFSAAEPNDKLILLNKIHALDQPRLIEAFNRGLLVQADYTIDLVFRTADERRWLRTKGRSFPGDANNPARFSGILSDVSAEVLANEKAHAAESLATLALEGSDAGSFSIDLRTGAFIFSPSLAKMLTGEASLEATRNVFMEHVHPDDAAARERAYLIAEETGYVNYEARFIWKDGSVHWVKIKGKYLCDLSGKPVSFSGIGQDISNDVAARKEQQKLLSLVEHSDDFIAVVNVNQEITYMNQAGLELIGLPNLEEAKKKKMLDLFAGDQQEKMAEQIVPQVLATGKWTGRQWLRNIGTGELIPFEVDAFRLDSPMSGKPMALACVARDLRAQLAANFALEQSERRFRSLIEEAPVATVLYVGKELVIEVANEQMLRLWGKDKSILGKPLLEAVPEVQGRPFLQILAAQFTSGVAYHSAESRVDLLVDRQLQTFYFHFTYKPLLNEAGEVFAILSMAVDITEQVLNRNQILETQRKLESAVDIADLGTWEIRPQENGFIVSDRMKTWMGYEPGKPVTMEEALSAIPDRAKVEAALEKALQPEGNGVLDVDYHVINRTTGQHYVMHSKGQAFFTKEKVAYLVLGTTQDITLQREIEVSLEKEVAERTEELASSNEELTASNEELAALNEEFSAMNEELQETNENLTRSNQELEQYAYVASHDLQEPLRKIRIYSDMLNHLQGLSEPHKKLVTKIDLSAQRMSMLIKDLLEFSRLLETGGMIEQVNLNTVLENVAGDFELVIEEQQARVIIGELPVIEGIRLQMNQLFYNLLGNALKFVQPGVTPVIEIAGRLVSSAELADTDNALKSRWYYEISVKDNGIGFDQKYADQVFQVFKRLHGSAAYPGSGIGLAMCKRIVLNHGGEMTVASEAGKGTTFRIILPALSR